MSPGVQDSNAERNSHETPRCREPRPTQAGWQAPQTFAGCPCIWAFTDSEGSAHSNWSYSCIIFSFSPALLPVYFLLSEEEEMLEPGTRYLLERSGSPFNWRNLSVVLTLEQGPPCLSPVGLCCYSLPEQSVKERVPRWGAEEP